MNNREFSCIGIERASIGIDGVGVRTLVGGYGCPLRCRYCLNPQGIDPSFTPIRYQMKDLLDKLSIDDLYFETTGGGITFGGGEPLLQSEFIHEFASEMPKSWNICVETSLSCDWELAKPVLDDVSMWIVDIKTMDDDIYLRYTGKPADMMKKNLKRLLEHVNPHIVYVKVPVIPGYADKASVEKSVDELIEMGVKNVMEDEYIIDFE